MGAREEMLRAVYEAIAEALPVGMKPVVEEQGLGPSA